MEARNDPGLLRALVTLGDVTEGKLSKHEYWRIAQALEFLIEHEEYDPGNHSKKIKTFMNGKSFIEAFFEYLLKDKRRSYILVHLVNSNVQLMEAFIRIFKMSKWYEELHCHRYDWRFGNKCARGVFDLYILTSPIYAASFAVRRYKSYKERRAVNDLDYGQVFRLPMLKSESQLYEQFLIRRLFEIANKFETVRYGDSRIFVGVYNVLSLNGKKYFLEKLKRFYAMSGGDNIYYDGGTQLDLALHIRGRIGFQKIHLNERLPW